MPIPVNDYSWEETPDKVVVTLPLNGVVPAKVDIYSNDIFIKVCFVHGASSYLQVSFPPFFCEIDLLHLVDDRASAATLGNGVAVFTLKKIEPKMWGTLLFKA